MFGRPAVPVFALLTAPVAALTALVAFALPAVASTSTPTIAVGGTASTQRDVVTLIGGSHQLLVYELQHRLASDVSGTSGLAAATPYVVIARAANGTKSRLAATDEIADLENWSVAGALVTAQHTSDVSRIDWWDVTTGSHGTLTLPPDARYLSAAPGGVLSMSADGTVVFESLAGVRTTWANPFGTRPFEVFTGIGPDGVVIGDISGHAVYIRYEDPTSARHLSLGLHMRPGQAAQVICWSVSKQYAACTTGGESRPNHGELVPLDGRRAIRPSGADERFGPVALIHGDHLVWQRFSAGGANAVLATISPSHKTVVGTRHPMFGSLRSAYGIAISTPRTGNMLWRATSAKHVVKLEAPPRSRATAVSFDLAGDRLLDIDDALRHGSSTPRLALRSRALSGAGIRLHLGAPTTLAKPSGPLVRNVQVSGSRYAYVTSKTGYPGTLHVVGKKHSTSIHHVVPTAGVSLSGRWIAYREQAAGEFARRLHVRNLVTGEDRIYAKQGDSLWQAAAISGATLYYAKPSGRILAANLATGKETELSGALPQFAAIRIYAAAGRVAWDIWQGGDNNARYTDAVRDADGTITQLDQRVVGVGASGALLSSQPLQMFGFAADAQPTEVTLRAWDDTMTPLLTDARLATEPQLVGDVLGWLTSDGVLRVAQVS